jgi:hypothetical protein
LGRVPLVRPPMSVFFAALALRAHGLLLSLFPVQPIAAETTNP